MWTLQHNTILKISQPFLIQSLSCVGVRDDGDGGCVHLFVTQLVSLYKAYHNSLLLFSLQHICTHTQIILRFVIFVYWGKLMGARQPLGYRMNNKTLQVFFMNVWMGCPETRTVTSIWKQTLIWPYYIQNESLNHTRQVWLYIFNCFVGNVKTFFFCFKRNLFLLFI